jgi:hypothetical protein
MNPFPRMFKTLLPLLLGLTMTISCVPPGTISVSIYVVNTALDKRPVNIKLADDRDSLALSLDLVDHPRIKPLVYENIAYLTGFVESREEMDKALAIVSKNNFRGVKTHLMLLSDISAAWSQDYATGVGLKNAILAEPDLNAVNIHLITAGGMVVLVGQVDTELQRRKATYLMERIGMQEIHNYLMVSPN